MRNCLKTQLKEVVQNDNLEKFNVLELIASNLGGWLIISAQEADSVLVTLTGATVTGGIDSTHFYAKTGGGSLYVTADSGISIIKAEASNKYIIDELVDFYPATGFKSIKYLPIKKLNNLYARVNATLISNLPQLDFDELRDSIFAQNIEMIKYDGEFLWPIKGSLSTIATFANLTTLGIPKSSIEGNLSDLVSLTKLETFGFTSCANISGDISSLGRIKTLKNMGCNSMNQITGSLESFVAAQRQGPNPRTVESEGVNIVNELGKATFNGTEIGRQYGNRVLTWTASTITFGGVTVNA